MSMWCVHCEVNQVRRRGGRCGLLRTIIKSTSINPRCDSPSFKERKLRAETGSCLNIALRALAIEFDGVELGIQLKFFEGPLPDGD